MLDKELVNRKLVQMSNNLSELEEVASAPKEKFIGSLIHYQAERLVELIVDNAIDINFHLIKKLGLKAPIIYKDSFKELGRKGILSNNFAVKIADSAGLRNILVHHYDELDLGRFYDNLKGGIEDYKQYIKTIKHYIDKNKRSKNEKHFAKRI